jgi:hypothetical protein
MRFEDAADVLLVGRSAEGPVDPPAAGPSHVARISVERGIAAGDEVLRMGSATGQTDIKNRRCAHTDRLVLASDPPKSDATGWINSELQPPK